MASPTEICNSALVLIGDFRISNLNDGTELARKCDARYNPLRRELLRSHTWNFAAKREKLAQLATDPVYEFNNAFALPADYIRLIALDTQENGNAVAEYRIENSKRVLTDFESLYLTYVSDVTDVSQFPHDFTEALTFGLARDLAISVAQSRSLADDMGREYRRLRTRAKSTDSIDDYSHALPAGTWNDFRYIGVGRSFRRRT